MHEDILLDLSSSLEEYIQTTRSPSEILTLFEFDAWIQIEDYYLSAEMFIELIDFFKRKFTLKKVHLNSTSLKLECKDGYLDVRFIEKPLNTVYLNKRSGRIQILNFSDKTYKLCFGGLLEYKTKEITALLYKLDFAFFMKYKVDVNIELIKAPLVYTFKYMKRLSFYENDDFTEEIRNIIEDTLYIDKINDNEEPLVKEKSLSKIKPNICLKSPQSSNWGNNDNNLNNIPLKSSSNDSLLSDENN